MGSIGRATGKNSIAHLRQLCCLGLSGELVMPAILRALHNVVPSDSNAFFWVDQNNDIANMCAERVLAPDLIELYFREFYNHPVLGFRPSFSKLLTSETGVGVAQLDSSFYRSEYYERVWRDLSAHFAVYALVRANGAQLGQLSMYRTRSDREFTAKDVHTLALACRYIAHALSLRTGLLSGLELGHHDADDVGLIVFNALGERQHACPNGNRLLLLATFPKISRSTMGLASGTEVPEALSNLCQRLMNVFRGDELNPPSLVLENCWGRFTFRAHFLSGAAGASSGPIGVTVKHDQPKALALLDRMVQRSLSVKERDVALLLAAGQNRGEIARRLAVTENTVGYYVKQVYGKLDVHDPRGMLDELLTT